jgi:hypothetical protein
VLVKILKQLVVTICLASILFSSPAIALASQNIEVHVPKGDLNITDKIDNTSTIIGINAIIDDTNLFGEQDFQYGLLVEPRYMSISEIVREIVFRTMPISIAIPIERCLEFEKSIILLRLINKKMIYQSNHFLEKNIEMF